MSSQAQVTEKDYTGDKQATKELVSRLKDYYYSRGYYNARFWIEEKKRFSSFGSRLPSLFFIKSNVSFDVDTLKGRIKSKT